MNPASKDICTILEEYGIDSSSDSGDLGLVFAENLFVGREPPAPDNCVIVFDIPGDAEMLTLDGQKGYYFPSVQVRVRNRNYMDGWKLIQDICNVLHGLHNVVVDGTAYDLIRAVDSPFLFDWDQNHRARFVADFNIYRKKNE